MKGRGLRMRTHNARACTGRGRVARATVAAVALLMLSGFLHGQESKGEKKLSVSDEIANVKAGILTPYGLDFLGQSNAVEAIPALEEQFSLAGDELDKAKISQVLVKLKDPKDEYWNYLAQLVEPVLRSTAPTPVAFDSQGKELPGVSPEFEAWVSTNKQDPMTAFENATILYGSYIMLVGATEDPRAAPLLRRALASRNFVVAAAASEGLALLGDAGSIQSIIAVAQRAPKVAAKLIASPLAYFNDAAAQRTLDRFVPAEEAQRLRDNVLHGRRPLHR